MGGPMGGPGPFGPFDGPRPPFGDGFGRGRGRGGFRGGRGGFRDGPGEEHLLNTTDYQCHSQTGLAF